MPAAPPLPTELALAELESLYHAFADPTRLRLLNVLAAGELCVCDLVTLLELPQSTVSRHLGTLHRAGLVTVSRDWKFAHYRLADAGDAIHAHLLDGLRRRFTDLPSLAHERTQAEACVRRRQRRPC